MSDNEYEESASGSESESENDIGEIKSSKKIPLSGDISDDAESDIDMDMDENENENENDDISDTDDAGMDDEFNVTSSQKSKKKEEECKKGRVRRRCL